ncbi:MAG: SGNH/GDSL hydrolase family protein [Bacteroidota bacterium]
MSLPPINPCNIDVSRYVALGDSITSGYMDGALYHEGQQHAYPLILATQFSRKNEVIFNQPGMLPDSVGVNLDGESRLVMKATDDPERFILSYLAPRGDIRALTENHYLHQGPYNNMGVPGAKAITAVMHGFGNPLNGPGYYNPFFTRMASNPAKASMLSDALLMDPTFFSLFIGNNDALGFALSGGTMNAITLPADFESSFKTIVNALTRNQAKGIVANLPSVVDIPYFMTIPYNGLLLTADGAETLNSTYASAGIHFTEGTNSFVVEDPFVQPGGIRQLEPGELVLLDLMLDEEKELYLSGKQAIPKKYSLFHGQLQQTQNAIDAYNTVIHAVAEEKNLALVDIRGLLKTAKPDRIYNPETLNIDYARKGIFSLDGLHPNCFGQALMANEFIRVINSAFHCDFEVVRSHRYKGIEFPRVR